MYILIHQGLNTSSWDTFRISYSVFAAKSVPVSPKCAIIMKYCGRVNQNEPTRIDYKAPAYKSIETRGNKITNLTFNVSYNYLQIFQSFDTNSDSICQSKAVSLRRDNDIKITQEIR